MELVYVCSPLRGDYEKNIENAKKYSLYVSQCGFIPITPHLYFTQFLNDTDEHQRNLGIEMGKYILKMCNELWVFGDYISQGMRTEINLALEYGLRLRFIDSFIVFHG